MHKKAVAVNTIVQFVGKLISIGINLVIVYFLTHHFSLTEFGEYTTVFSYLLIFNILADLGLSTILVRDIHEYEDQERPKFIGNIIIIRTISLIVSLTIGVIIAQFVPQYNQVIKLGILVGSGSVFFLLLSVLIFSIFQTQLKMQRSVYANALGLIFNLLFVVIFIKLHLSIDFAILAVTLGYFVMFLTAAFFTYRTQKVSFNIDRKIWKEVLQQSITIGGTIIFSTIYFKSDSLILSLLKPYYVLSLYSVPYKILEVFIAVPQMFMAPVFALMAKELKQNNIERFKNMFQKAFDFLLLAGLPIIPGALFLSNKIILLYAGPSYAPSIDILKILSIAVFLSFLGSSFIFILLALKKQHYLFVWNIFLSIFNVGLNFILIPHYSYYASAWLTVATEALVLSGSVYFVNKTLHFVPRASMLARGLAAAAGFTLILWVTSPLNLFIQTALSLIVYAGIILGLKAVSLEEIKEIIR